MPGARGSGRPPVEQQAQVLLRRDDRLRLVAGVRRDDDLGEGLDDLLRGLGVEQAVQRDDAAEGRDRVAGQRLRVGVEKRGAFGDAARIGVLDDGDGGGARRIELADQFEGGVGVVDVVVGQLLALQLASPWRRPARLSPVT